MSSNEKSMTLEEKLVQHIKDDKLIMLLGDEDAITQLTERAVREALFQQRRVATGRYNGDYTMADSPVVEAARTIAAAAIQRITDQMVKELLENAKITLMVRDAFIAQLPIALQQATNQFVMDARAKSAVDAIQMLQEGIRQGYIKLGT
jgi:hypothetical protein